MSRAVIVAHRGLSAGPRHGAPENTVAAIAAAAASGANAVELDVRRTRDGQLVLAHDPVQIGRLHRPQLVRWSRRSALPMLCGLGDALDAAFAAGLAVKLDVKHARALGLIAQRCLEWCAERGADSAWIALWCRSAAAISRLPVRSAFAEVALLSDSPDPVSYPAAAAACGANAVSLHPRAQSAVAVSAAHGHGLTVYAWIRDPDGHDGAVALGVDGLVTDWIERARAALAD